MVYMTICVLYSQQKRKTQIDEASDTYDTIDWLVKTQQTITEMWAFGGFPTQVFIPLILLLSNHSALELLRLRLVSVISRFSP
jgi:predicted acyl esterase